MIEPGSRTTVLLILVLLAAILFPQVTTVQAQSTDPEQMRSQIIARAQTWVEHEVPYNQSNYPDGYRADCSGFVSYAWQLTNGNNKPSSPDTVALGNSDPKKGPVYATDIRFSVLQPGDIINNKRSGNDGHVVIFIRWRTTLSTFEAYEENADPNGDGNLSDGKAIKSILTLESLPGDQYTIKEFEDYTRAKGPYYAQRNISLTASSGQTATALVVDVSGSMAANWQGGVKIESAKQAAADVVTMIEQESQAGQGAHQIALVSFTTDASLESPLSADYAGMRAAIDRLGPSQNTNLGAGVEIANQALSAAPADAKKIMILLSDGMSNTGLANPEILSGPVQAAANAGTCIYTVGFGDPGEIDEQLLRDIAGRSGCGTYTYASAPADLARIYVRLRHTSTGTIIGEFQGQIAQGETVQIGQVDVLANQGQLNVTLLWPGSRLELIAKDPSGKTIADGQPGVSIAQTARMVNLLVQNPAAGNWQFAAVGADVPEQQLTYNLIASVRTAGTTRTGGGSAGLLIALVVGVLIGVPVVVYSARRRRQVGGVPASAVAQLIGPSGEQLPISDGAVLGRDPDCAIRLLDDAVSRQHVQFRYARGAWYIQDLNSSNGTFINGARVTATALRDGDRIAIGPYELKFRIGL
jgi:Mg-chelatase subunit ChlD